MPRLNPLEWARNGVTAGLSGRQAYGAMMDEAGRLTGSTGERWTGVARATFFEIYSGVRYAREQIPEAMGAPKDIPGGGLEVSTRGARVASGYLHAGVSFTRPIGGVDVERGIHLFRSDELLTPQQVEDLIRSQIEESAMEAHGTFTGMTIEGISFTGVQQLIRQPDV
jgi:hypothetical protein